MLRLKLVLLLTKILLKPPALETRRLLYLCDTGSHYTTNTQYNINLWYLLQDIYS